ncbi:C40 family peptidase [Streptomyces platensis]|uniref:C40 family peptidase n=1 Tax=Streptomyces platensis TaxID=58346 RepID=UPI002E15D81E|nr:C40 family peptidase [Streptomyces platensis]WTI54529.1 C40 family peptidase [Streptomyces platensis]WUB79865.1 C40 family peptidase [Streptomyces platensis]
MSAKTQRGRRRVLHAVTVTALLAGSAYLTVALRAEEQTAVPAIPAVTDEAGLKSPLTRGLSGDLTWERLRSPARSVLRGEKGEVFATFTDGARTATLTGRSRTFTEPAATRSRIVTDNWVRMMPEPWRKGAEKEKWFKDWFKDNFGSEKDDLFAMAFQYVAQAPAKQNAAGVRYAGDANYGPIAAHGGSGAGRRLEESDFYDYLGIPYTFRDGTSMQPERARARSMDCSGFIRAVLGYRAGYPLRADDRRGDGLPRTANGMARSGLGADVVPLTGSAPAFARPASIDLLQPGDLVFFKLEARTEERLDHVGMYLGNDSDGHQVFISSRQEVNGPTIGDKGGTSRLDGNGYYARALRSAKRL